MSWYRNGTVTVTTGSKNVTGEGTLWASSVNVGDAFALVDANGNPTGAWYEVETVTSNTALVLKQTYTGTPEPGSNKQYAVFNLVGNMTTPSFAQRLAQFFDQFQNLVDLPTTTPTASSIPIAGSGGTLAAGWLPAATDAVKGAVELATAAEATAGNDTTRAITPSVSGSRLTFAATSTDDATSATAAPLKSAGGLAAAGNAWIGKSLKVGLSERHVYHSSDDVDAGQSIFCTFVLRRWKTAIIDLRVSMANQAYDAGRYAHISAQLHHNNAGELVVRRTNLALHTFLAESIVISKPSGTTNTTVTIQITNNHGSMLMNAHLLLLDIAGDVSPVEFSVGNS